MSRQTLVEICYTIGHPTKQNPEWGEKVHLTGDPLKTTKTDLKVQYVRDLKQLAAKSS